MYKTSNNFIDIKREVAKVSQEKLELTKEDSKEFYFYLGIMYCASKLAKVYANKGKDVHMVMNIDYVKQGWETYKEWRAEQDKKEQSHQISMEEIMPEVFKLLDKYLKDNKNKKKDKSEE